jgi:hypothetical protein
MDPATKAAREQRAFERLDASAAWLGQRFHVTRQADALVHEQEHRGFVKDPIVAGLYRREALADLLDAVIAEVQKEAETTPPGRPGDRKATSEPHDVKAAVQAPGKAPPRRAEPAPEATPEPAKAVPRRGYPAVPAPDKASEKAPEKSSDKAPETPVEKPAPDGGERR